MLIHLKKFLLILMLLSGGCMVSVAQTTRHTLSFDIGAFPFTNDMEVFDGYDGYYRPDLIDLWSGKSRAVPGKLKTTGALTLTYHYRVKKWLEVGASVSYAGFFQQWHHAQNESRHYFYFMPGVHFFWLDRPVVEMYSGARLGYGFVSASTGWNSHDTHFGGGQITLAGIRVGKERFYFFSEIGFGMKGLINGGVGYKF